MPKYYQFEQFQFSLQLHTCSAEHISNVIAIAALGKAHPAGLESWVRMEVSDAFVLLRAPRPNSQ